MKATLGRAVMAAYRSLGDLVEKGTLTIPAVAGFDWSGVGAQPTEQTVNVEMVLVDEKLNHGRDSTKQRWAIIKFDKMVEHFSVLTVGGRKYRCGAPLVSYKFIVMVEVYEVQ